MQETIVIEREISSDDLFYGLANDFPRYDVDLALFGWIAVDVSVDVTVRLKVRRNRVTIYARRRVAPGILGALFSGLASNYAELELTRELKQTQNKFMNWIRTKYGQSVGK